MERVVCISHAKVPIVKIWDPELRLACDMNVNNTLALENTRMVRTYVEIDERVRPLAMIVKHWTKRRILNDAGMFILFMGRIGQFIALTIHSLKGLGGTLSSYTWICLIINFLQTRDPPILPSLQARPHKKRLTADGLVCSFDDDLDALVGYGSQNKQSLGELFFQFFRYYGHELDYEKYVISVREGRLISKEGKGWHLLQNNRLCVEEPFNTIRNLGNTADDTSFRGVHMELRRAFKCISDGSFEDCCQKYEYPPEAERSWERPPPQPRPVVTAPPPSSSRGGRGGGRGGRHQNQYNRGGHSGGRRSSNTGNKNHFRQPNGGISASELSLQAQHAQYLLHDHLYQQIQILQAQEQELRLQLQNQALLTGRPPPVLIRQPFIQFPVPAQETSGDDGSRSRSGSRSSTVNQQQPISVPGRQNVYYNSAYLPVTVPGGPGSSTNPPSPSATTAMPDLRRNPRRSSVANGSPGGSTRAQSQPARPVNSLPSFAPLYSISQSTDNSQSSKQRNTPGSPDDSQSEDGASTSNSLPNRTLFMEDGRPNDYMGYYLGSSPQLHAYHQNAMLSPLPSSLGLALPNGSIIPFYGNPQEYMSAATGAEAYGQSFDNGPLSSPKSGQGQQRTSARTAASSDRGGPLIVDGSVPPSEQRISIPAENYDPYGLMSHCPSNSDDQNTDTPASVSDSFSQDFQDSSSVEIDSNPFFSRQAVDSNTMRTSPDVFLNGQSGKPSLLSSRLQGLHVSNGEKLAESPSKPLQEKLKGPQSHRDFAEREAPRQKNANNADKGQSLTNFVAAAESHSPNGKRRHHGSDLPEKANGTTHKGKPKNRSDVPQSQNAGPGDQKERTGGASRKSNGVGSAAQDSSFAYSHTAWQTTKKKNKKNNKFNSDHRQGIHNGVEPLPVDESMRKGG